MMEKTIISKKKSIKKTKKSQWILTAIAWLVILLVLANVRLMMNHHYHHDEQNDNIDNMNQQSSSSSSSSSTFPTNEVLEQRSPFYKQRQQNSVQIFNNNNTDLHHETSSSSSSSSIHTVTTAADNNLHIPSKKISFDTKGNDLSKEASQQQTVKKVLLETNEKKDELVNDDTNNIDNPQHYRHPLVRLLSQLGLPTDDSTLQMKKPGRDTLPKKTNIANGRIIFSNDNNGDDDENYNGEYHDDNEINDNVEEDEMKEKELIWTFEGQEVSLTRIWSNMEGLYGNTSKIVYMMGNGTSCRHPLHTYYDDGMDKVHRKGSSSSSTNAARKNRNTKTTKTKTTTKTTTTKRQQQQRPMTIAVAGVFNSGTNLLGNLLERNCYNIGYRGQKDQPILWQVPWYVRFFFSSSSLSFCFVLFGVGVCVRLFVPITTN